MLLQCIPSAMWALVYVNRVHVEKKIAEYNDCMLRKKTIIFSTLTLTSH